MISRNLLPFAALVAVGFSTSACDPVRAPAPTPEQSGAREPGPAALDAPPRVMVSEQIQVEPILPQAGNPTQALQSGGSDLCDPSADPELARRAGIDCAALAAAAREAAPLPPQRATGDPLLREGTRERRAFDALDLGDGVPSTVILNP